MNNQPELAGYGTHLRKTRDQLVARVEQLEALLKEVRLYQFPGYTGMVEAPRPSTHQAHAMTTDPKPEEQWQASALDRQRDLNHLILEVQGALLTNTPKGTEAEHYNDKLRKIITTLQDLRDGL